MARETAKAKWSDQQLLFVSQLHLLTVMMLTGKVNVVAQDENNKTVMVEDEQNKAAAAKPPPTCSDTERQKVAEQIKAFVGAEMAPETKK
jgi:hypothetical protein